MLKVKTMKVKCPYCQHENTTHIPKDVLQPWVGLCDLESGGCSQDFVVRMSTKYIRPLLTETTWVVTLIPCKIDDPGEIIWPEDYDLQGTT